MERQRWADFSLVRARINCDGFPIFILFDLCDFEKLIFRIIAADVSHLGQNGQPEGNPTVAWGGSV